MEVCRILVAVELGGDGAAGSSDAPTSGGVCGFEGFCEDEQAEADERDALAAEIEELEAACLLYTSPSPRDS